LSGVRLLICDRSKIFAGFILAVLVVPSVFAESFRWVTLSTTRTRALALGGACMAVEDDLGALNYNPATYAWLSPVRNSQVSIFFNAVGPAAMFQNPEIAKNTDVWLGWLVKGFAAGFGRLQAGLVFGEQSIRTVAETPPEDFFDGSSYRSVRTTLFGLSMALASNVSLGVGGEVLMREGESMRNWRVGYRYGLLIRMKYRVSVGLCFIDQPKGFDRERNPLDRLVDETLNVGIAFHPWSWVNLSVDVRNVSDESKGMAREPHAGIEVIPWRHISMRGGCSRNWENDTNAYSFGLGILDWNQVITPDRRFIHPTFAVQASAVFEEDAAGMQKWVLLTCVLRY
jgi:hypothetical protein